MFRDGTNPTSRDYARKDISTSQMSQLWHLFCRNLKENEIDSLDALREMLSVSVSMVSCVQSSIE